MRTPLRPSRTHGRWLARRGLWHKQLALPRECGRLSEILLRHWYWELPEALLKELWQGTGLERIWDPSRLADVVGRVLLRLFDELGPMYGKAAQTAMSRMSPGSRRLATQVHLDRLYGDWPPLPLAAIKAVLDREIPAWRGQLHIEPNPLGVASMAQVHAATDQEGRAWVIKVLKPHAVARLLETLGAIEQVLTVAQRLPLSRAMRRFIQESEDLCVALRAETDLLRERQNLDKARESLAQRRSSQLRIPEAHPQFCTRHVLVMQRFHGVRFSELLASPTSLPEALRKKMARRTLAELLVQIFEDGVFHADPHAGNLMLLDDGSIGLFDWGLAGELAPRDKQHIAAILKAVLAMRLDRLVDALASMARDSGRDVRATDIERELKDLASWASDSDEEGRRPRFSQMMEACLAASDRLGIEVPEGLLMMVKSLLTIEGLAKGLDPDIAFTRVAAPVLFKAARPGLRDVLDMGLGLPKLAKRWWGGGKGPAGSPA